MSALKGSGKNGTSFQRLYSRYRVTSLQSSEFADAHPTLVEKVVRLDQQKRQKTFLVLRSEQPPEPPARTQERPSVASEPILDG